MCGIVGYTGSKNAAEVIFDGLTRLEYRGYDSAGIAVFDRSVLQIRRAEGKLARLKEVLQREPLMGFCGIGHTRWATHGKPSEVNAHPHRAGPVVVVHNGIIENYVLLREKLEKQGCRFESETDTEIVAHLFHQESEKESNLLRAFHNTLNQMKGSYALAVLHDREPESVFIARHQSPLVVGVGENEHFVASDIPALLPYTREVIFLEDGDWGCLGQKEMKLFDSIGLQVQRPIKKIEWNLTQAEKGGFKHFMLKEIHESPRAFIDTLRGRVSLSTGEIFLEGVEPLFKLGFKWNKIYLVACGTSYHAALLGKFYLEEFVKIPVFVDVASEFRYRESVLDDQTLLIVISQSGETADTLSAVKKARAQGAQVYSICNVLDASIPRESDAVFYTHAGPEIGVAATKTFLTQMEALLLIALYFGSKRGITSSEKLSEYWSALSSLPEKMEMLLAQNATIQSLVKDLGNADQFLFVGRGYQYPIALEGALKLKEISYLHAEGYPAGELKHGPIAMIDQGTPVIGLALEDVWYEKMVSNLQEVLARSANLILLTTDPHSKLATQASRVIEIPKTLPALYPLLTCIPLQLFAYAMADLKGHDVDQPRNLAKSVTVE